MIEIDENFTTVAKTSAHRSYGFNMKIDRAKLRGLKRRSVDLDLSVNLVDENIRGVEGDGAGEDGEGERDQGRVAEVEQGWNKGRDLELGEKVEHRVHEDVGGAASADNVAPPPPVVVFGAELEVDHDDADLRA